MYNEKLLVLQLYLFYLVQTIYIHIHLFSIRFRMTHQFCELVSCEGAFFGGRLVHVGRLLAKHGL